ncbi:MAG: hypothetical protein J2P21_32565 [Chloracidobacterium sp.]|nr:hypothetical protein [Chloracidobacterium sp.]
MESTIGQRSPFYWWRQTLQPAHPLDPLCGLLEPPPDQFFVEGPQDHEWIAVYEMDTRPLGSKPGAPDEKWASVIKTLIYSLINNFEYVSITSLNNGPATRIARRLVSASIQRAREVMRRKLEDLLQTKESNSALKAHSSRDSLNTCAARKPTELSPRS